MVHGSSGRSRGGLEGGGGAAEGLEHGVPVAEVFGDDLHEGGAHDDACGARFERAPDVPEAWSVPVMPTRESR